MHAIIRRGDLLLGIVKEKNDWNNRYHHREIPEGKAKIISPQLALYQYQKATAYWVARYHVIHLLTGLVIADVDYSTVKHVKQTFEGDRWILRDGNTFVLDSSKTLQWQFTCLLKYEIIRIEDDGPQT